MKSKLLKILSTSLIMLMCFSVGISSALQPVDINKPCVVIHPGEYPGKLGKRSYFADEIPNLDKDKYPLENGNELGEYYLNKQYCKKVAEYIRKKDSRIQVIEFDSKDRSTDLNAAGRTSNAYNADLYLAIHHNCSTNSSKTPGTASGFICMTAQGKYASKSVKVAKHISKNIDSVGDQTDLYHFVGKKDGVWTGNTYVGELNEATAKGPAVLIEMSFFDNVHDLKISTNQEKIDIISEQVASAIVKEFHDGTFDNDQYNETKQNTVRKEEEEIEANKNANSSIKVEDDKDKDTKKVSVSEKSNSKVQKMKEIARTSKIDLLKSKKLGSARMKNARGKDKINSILKK